MKKKNITIFLNAFWNSGKGMSGGDQMLIQIFKRIRNEFGNVDCYTNIDGRKVIENDVQNINYQVSDESFDQMPLAINYIFRTLQSLKVLFKGNVDIIYSGSDFFPDVFPSFMYKLLHPKTKWVQCIFHVYTGWKERPGNKVKNFIAQYAQKISFQLVKKADVIVNINYQVKEELIKLGFKERKIVVNTPGINIEYLENLKISSNTKNYEGIFLARLNPSKGIFDLVKIWKGVVAEKSEVRLAIIGGGSDEIKKKLRNDIQKEGLEKNIDVLGFLENDESFSIMKNSKIFIFPSHEEGFGIVIAEAMVCNIPAVSWNLPVYKEIFEDNCIQVEENNIKLFVEKILEFMEDGESRNKLTAKARKFVNKYSWDSISEKHRKILENGQSV